jgi:hypothetical protein
LGIVRSLKVTTSEIGSGSVKLSIQKAYLDQPRLADSCWSAPRPRAPSPSRSAAWRRQFVSELTGGPAPRSR